MIRFIAALDSKNGIADDHGIPWRGKLPSDVHYYRDKLETGTILMGYGVYNELSEPYPGGINYVATTKSEPLRQGFTPVPDARGFLQSSTGDIWDIGGAGLYSSTIDLADELYLTRIDHDFLCTKFFPEYRDSFSLKSKSEVFEENGLSFWFEVWQKTSLKKD
ncbi:MAG TPA: dihydrofolate reductase [Candidatus Binatia bacterium]|nr:dihydrofolate reductase [Candidatus Binatia bacterium]